MEKLIYITSDSWWDTDITLLPDLGKCFKLEVFCFSYDSVKKGKYPYKKLPSYITFHNCQFYNNYKSLKTIVYSVAYGIYLSRHTKKIKTIWVAETNPFFCYPFCAFSDTKSVIVSLHNYYEHIGTKKWGLRLKKYILRRFLFFHFHSNIQESYFKKDYPNKFSFSTRMLPKDFGKPMNNGKKMFANGKRTFLFFGNIKKYKRVDLFIKASNIMKGYANFVIAGNCNDWSDYSMLIDKDNPMKCDIRFIDNNEIADYYTQSDFIVLPYEDSTQSGPLLTAYNYSLPMITSSLSYFKEMNIDGVTGFIFEQGNLESLVSVIGKAVNLDNDSYNEMKDALKDMCIEYKKQSNFSVDLISFLNRNSI